MSTLSLDDLDPKMRRELGLDASCRCRSERNRLSAVIRVVEIRSKEHRMEPKSGQPGADWIESGLHRLRVPRDDKQICAASSEQVSGPDPRPDHPDDRQQVEPLHDTRCAGSAIATPNPASTSRS